MKTRGNTAPKGGRTRPKRLRDQGSCRLDLSDLAERTGYSDAKLAEAKGSLVRSRVLVESADGSLSINMAFREWIFPATGRRRLAERVLRSIEGGRP